MTVRGLSLIEYADEQTAAATARNATINLPDESEAPSSPTIVDDIAPQPKTLPGKHVNLDDTQREPRQSRPGSVMATDAGMHDSEEKHARFAPLDTDQLESHGEFFAANGHLTAPVDGRESQKGTPRLKPILLDVQPTSPKAQSAPLSPSTRPSFDEARRGDSIAPTDLRTEEASARKPSELEQAASLATGQTSEPSQGRMLPPPGPQRMETELPEGTGSRRLFKMSKMFSESSLGLKNIV